MTQIYGAIFDQPQPNSPAAQAKIEAGDYHCNQRLTDRQLEGFRANDFSDGARHRTAHDFTAPPVSA
jgi:hypothetical protein